MKVKILSWLVILLSFFFFITNCNGEKIPAIKFSNYIYKFGEIAEGEKVEYTFSFINSGSDTLIITNVKGTCGCTVPGDYTKEIAPGKSGEIPVIFNSQGFKGVVVKTIKVETNIPELEPISLTLEGKINVLIDISARSIWLGQTKKDGPPLTGSVVLKNNTETPMKILKAEPSGERCAVKVATIEEGQEYSVEVTISPPFNQDQVREILNITTNIPGKEEMSIQYHYYGIPEIEVSPKKVIVHSKHLQPDLTRIIGIISHTDASIEIINPRVNGENLDLTIDPLVPGKHIQLMLHFKEGFTFPENKVIDVSFSVKTEQGETSYTIPIMDGDNL